MQGEILTASAIATTTTTAGPFFWQQPNNVNINAPAMAKPGQEYSITRVGGGDGRQIDVVVTISRRLIKAANGNAGPPTYHHSLLPLDPFYAFTTFSLAIEWRGLGRNNLFWLY